MARSMIFISVNREGDDYGPLEVELGTEYEFAWRVTTEAGAFTDISAATITIRKGATKYVDAASVDLNTNELTYKWLAADHPENPEEGVIVEVNATSSTGSGSFRTVLDVVRFPLFCPITEADLFQSYPKLDDMRRLGLVEGTPKAGTTTELTDEQLAGIAYDLFYKRGRIEIIDGTNTGQWRTVTNFDGISGVVTWAAPMPAAVDTTSRYRLRRSWQPVIAEAWADVRKRIRDRGNRPALIMDSQAFRQCTILIAAARCYRAWDDGAFDDPMGAMADDLEKMGWEAFDRTNFIYDATDSGDPTNVYTPHVVHVSRR